VLTLRALAARVRDRDARAPVVVALRSADAVRAEQVAVGAQGRGGQRVHAASVDDGGPRALEADLRRMSGDDTTVHLQT
jgi:hypothetical protein